MERREQRLAHKEDLNCGPLSLVMDAKPLDPSLIKGSCAVYGGGGGEWNVGSLEGHMAKNLSFLTV